MTFHLEYPLVFSQFCFSDPVTEDVFKQPEGRPVSATRHHQPKYELATHTVKVRRTGILSDVVKLWDLQGTCRYTVNVEIFAWG